MCIGFPVVLANLNLLPELPFTFYSALQLPQFLLLGQGSQMTLGKKLLNICQAWCNFSLFLKRYTFLASRILAILGSGQLGTGEGEVMGEEKGEWELGERDIVEIKES